MPENAMQDRVEGVLPGAPRLAAGSEVLWSSPLPHLDTGWGQAFALRPREGAVPLYALVCRRAIPLRHEILSSLRKVENPGIVGLEDFGIVKDVRDGRDEPALVFVRPPEERLWPDMKVPRPPMGEDEVVRQVVRPVVQTLRFLWSRGIHHGAIRPSGMFVGASGVVLGECVSEPPSFSQPAIFEPFERALAHPCGRGDGNSRDDVFSLAVSIIFLCLGRSPVEGVAEKDIMLARAEMGSYALLVGRNRLPAGLVEPLRGMLSDDPALRWDIAELEKWLEGHRQAAKSAKGQLVSARPIAFAGQELHRARAVAMEMPARPDEALALVKSGELGRWLRRSLADSATADRIDAVLAEEGDSKEKLVSRAILALDPSAPLAWNGYRVFPGGIGNLMTALLLQGQDLSPLVSMIVQRLPMAWLSAQVKLEQGQGEYVHVFDRLCGLVSQTGAGFGAERCLYELQPGIPCLSPLMKGRMAFGGADVLAVLEDNVDVLNEGSEGRIWPFDRHMLAFFAARERTLPEAMLKSSAMAGSQVDRVLALARIMAFIQERHHLSSLPKLCGWVVAHSGDAVERFHNRNVRKSVRRQVGEVAAQGSLAGLVNLLSDPDSLTRDGDGFSEARAQYHRISAGIARMRKEEAQRQAQALALGRRLAVILSSVLAGILLLFMFAGGVLS